MPSRISGQYKQIFNSQSEKEEAAELELRIDVDGERPLNMVSGDLFSNSEKTRRYLKSFRFETIEKTETQSEIQINGELGKCSQNPNHFHKIKIILHLGMQPLQATVQLTNNQNTSKHTCKLKSPHFRTIQIEQDSEEDTEPFEPYNTYELLSPTPNRTHPINIINAYAEAGIKIVPIKKKRTAVPHPNYITFRGSIWTDDELYKTMCKHFSRLKNEPQWTVWLFSALKYSLNSVKGIMLMHGGKERIGCVVFQKATGWQTPQQKRLRLFICVHELGHCFNLTHPWKKQKDPSIKENGYATLSWMNYPWKYYQSKDECGQEAFWKAFNFQFSDQELIHLRHGFRNDVIFGGNPFKQEP
jgi:hypothetical protein